MLALLAALTLTAAPPPTAAALRAATETPNVYRLPEHCRNEHRVDVPRERPAAQKLGHLPPAHLHLPVNRTVNGCPAPTIVRYNVDERFGPARALNPPGRGGEPSNRR